MSIYFSNSVKNMTNYKPVHTPSIKQRNEHFLKLFQKYLTREVFGERREKTMAIDIGCGGAPELATFGHYLAMIGWSHKVKIVGIDIDYEVTLTARDLLRITDDRLTGADIVHKIISGNAIKLYSELVRAGVIEDKETFDLALMRHPHVLKIPKVYEKILAELYHCVKPNAPLMITCYYEAEVERMIEIIKREGSFKVLTKEQYNDRTTEGDSYIIIAKAIG